MWYGEREGYSSVKASKRGVTIVKTLMSGFAVALYILFILLLSRFFNPMENLKI